MKITCPNCGQEFDVSAEHIGRRAICDACQKEFTIRNPNLIQCPSCFKEISREAENCPHCGHTLKTKTEPKEIEFKYTPLTQSNEPKPSPSNKVITTELTSKKLKARLIISVTLILIGVFMLFTKNEKAAVFGLIFILIGVLYKVITKIKIWWYHK